MKTNHRRGFVATTPRDQSMFHRTVKLASGRAMGVATGNDFTDGHRGAARAKSGAKKALRTAERRDAAVVIVQQSE